MVTSYNIASCNLFRSTATPSDELLSCTSLFLGLLESLCSPLPQSMNNKIKPEFEEKIKTEIEEKIQEELEEKIKSEFEEKIKSEPDMEEQAEKPPLLENLALSRTVCLPAKLVKTVYTETNANKLERLIHIIKVSDTRLSVGSCDHC